MARRRVNTTKHEIIQVAMALFLEVGVTQTSPKMIAEKLELSTGNITYYFPTKEHLLAVLVDMLCDFRKAQMERQTAAGIPPIVRLCMEYAAMITLCSEQSNASDVYRSAYASDLCLELIQRHKAERARRIFAPYHPEWTAEQYARAAVMVSGIDQTSLRINDFVPSVKERISVGLDAILSIYGVPAEERRELIAKVTAIDCSAVAQKEFQAFTEYVARITEETLDDLFNQMRYRYD